MTNSQPVRFGEVCVQAFDVAPPKQQPSGWLAAGAVVVDEPVWASVTGAPAVPPSVPAIARSAVASSTRTATHRCNARMSGDLLTTRREGPAIASGQPTVLPIVERVHLTFTYSSLLNPVPMAVPAI